MGITDSDEAAGPAVVAEDGSVVLVRYRIQNAGESSRTVHVVAVPAAAQAGMVVALCGTVLLAGDLEDVAAGEGMPCISCVLHYVTDAAVTGIPTQSGPDYPDYPVSGMAGDIYRQCGWPVTQHRGRVRLHLDRTVSAMLIPAWLGAEVIPVLIQRWCAPPVLAHPYLPEHHIVLTGERFGFPLPWPGQVHQITGSILLPPTPTPRGPITWITTPHPDSLQLCREIDLFTALRSSNSAAPRLEDDQRYCLPFCPIIPDSRRDCRAP